MTGLSIEDAKTQDDVLDLDGLADKTFADLPVVDLEGVEIAAADVTVFGNGSPENGDTYSLADLQRIAADSNCVADDLRPPVKLGHDKQQRLLRASGLWGEQPRTGTLKNFRVEGDKMLCDIKSMPGKLADLVKSGAFRLRSMEIGPARSQRTSETYPTVVKGLALLGATTPAFQTLDDIHALYAGAERAQTQELFFADQKADPADDLIFTNYAVGDVVWDDEDGVQDIMRDVGEQINPQPPGSDSYFPRYWVMDLQLIDVDGDGDVPGPRALVGEYGNGAAWVVPLTFADGEPVVPPANEWILAEQAWVQASASGDDEGSTDMTDRGDKVPADTTRSMADESNKNERPDLDEAQVAHFAAALGLEGDDVTAEKVYEALDAKLAVKEEPKEEPKAPPVAPPKDDGTRSLSENEYQALRSMAERGAAAAESLRVKERYDTIVLGGVKAGKIDPANVKFYEEQFDQNPETVKQIISMLPVQDGLLQVYGGDGDGLDSAYSEQDERGFAEYCRQQGIPYIPAIRSVA